jgi:parallel beta-helix repeat protein
MKKIRSAAFSKFLVLTFIGIAILSVILDVKAADTIYYVSPTGSDSNSGTSISSPYLTYKKALSVATESSTVYIRAGTYTSSGNEFANSNVTVRNYPGEQVIIQLAQGASEAFSCYNFRPRTGIRIIGSDVTPVTLSNGVVSQKGIVITDEVGSQRIPLLPNGGCDNWEIAGVDFIDVANAIFQLKQTSSQTGNRSSDNWYVHDNRVYRYYRETGMQFNGNENVVENNQILKGTSQLNTPFGCYLLNILGHGNNVRGNTLTGTGGNECSGILFEWSQSDANTIENNTITGVRNGIELEGGDNNIIRDNYISSSASGIEIVSHLDGRTEWPCSDFLDSGDPYPEVLIPPNDPTHPDYPYYYPFGECQSYGTTITSNTIVNSEYGILINVAPLLGTTTIENNSISNYLTKDICNLLNSSCISMASNIDIVTTYYVSALGNDNNSGTSTSDPWQTLSKVKTQAYNPGDKILFRAGDVWEYIPAGTFDASSSGIAGKEIYYGRYGTGANPAFKNMQVDTEGIREKAAFRIQGKSYIIIDGIDVINGATGFSIIDSSYITLRNTLVTGTETESGGIVLTATSNTGPTNNIIIEDFRIVGANRMGWGIVGSENVLNTITVRRGTIEEVGQTGGEQKHGIYANNWQNFLIEDVVITDPWNAGIKIVSESHDGVIRRVSIIRPGRNGSGESGPGVSMGDTRVSHVRNITYDHVIIWNANESAIAVYDHVNGVHNITIDHCIFVNSKGASLNLPAGTTGWIVKNSIGFQNSAWMDNDWRVPLYLEGSTTDITNNTFNYNVWFFKNAEGTYNPVRIASTTYTLNDWKALNGNPDSNSFSLNPMFVDYDGGNFHIPTDSSLCSAGEAGTYIGSYPCDGFTPTDTPTITSTVTPTLEPTFTTIPTDTVAPTLASTPMPTPTTTATTTPIITTVAPTHTTLPTNTTRPTSTIIRTVAPTNTPVSLNSLTTSISPSPTVTVTNTLSPTNIPPTQKQTPMIKPSSLPTVTPSNPLVGQLGSILGVDLANTIVSSPIITIGICLFPIIIILIIWYVKNKKNEGDLAVG